MIAELRADAERPARLPGHPATARRGAPPQPVEPQRRSAPVRARRHALRGHRETAAERAISPTTPRTRTRVSASCSGSTPPPARCSIYSIGLRNPYRFSFDLVTDPAQPRIAIGDVGQDRFDEIDYLPFAAAAGANFGWNDFEGFAPFSGAHPPTPSRNREADRGPQHLRRRLRDHRRLRGPRLAAAAALPPLCLRRLLHRQDPLPDPRAWAERERTAAPGCGWRT